MIFRKTKRLRVTGVSLVDTTDCFAQDSAAEDKLILVNGLDQQIGTATKRQTHVEGLLHRAFSVLLVRDGVSGPEVLLARRAVSKYHCAGLWANSCCSHPRLGEKTTEAAMRRVQEELGCEVCDLREVTAFAYRAEFANGLIEHEYDHVFVGRCEGTPSPDPAEVDALRWVSISDLARELYLAPKQFAPWAPMVLTLAIRQLADK